jgi:hypothetical protein
MRIALWNASGLDNLGDRLIDRVCRGELARRLPDASFATFAPWLSREVPLVSIDRDGRWTGERQFDAIVIGGGALLIGPPFIHPSLQTCYLGPYPERFRDPCPVVWNAVCCDGQFVSTLAAPWRGYVRAACSRLTYRSVRNRYTAEFLLDCEVKEPVDVVPDPVTLLQPPQSRDANRRPRRIGLALGLSGSSERFISQLQAPTDPSEWNPAVCVRVPADHGAAKTAAAASRLQQLVNRIAAAVGAGHSAEEIEVCAFGRIYGDRETASALANALACRMILPDDGDGDDALKWISSLDCLVASRLHACILALVAGTPFVAVDPNFNAVSGNQQAEGADGGCAAARRICVARKPARPDGGAGRPDRARAGRARAFPRDPRENGKGRRRAFRPPRRDHPPLGAPAKDEH